MLPLKSCTSLKSPHWSPQALVHLMATTSSQATKASFFVPVSSATSIVRTAVGARSNGAETVEVNGAVSDVTMTCHCEELSARFGMMMLGRQMQWVSGQ